MSAPTDEEIREMAKARVGFRIHALAYVLVNLLLVVIWWTNADGGAPTFRDDSSAYFWPVWSILGWGVGLAMHGFSAYGGGRDAVAREEAKLREKLGGR